MAVITDKYGVYSLYRYWILLFDICRKGEKIEISQKVKKNIYIFQILADSCNFLSNFPACMIVAGMISQKYLFFWTLGHQLCIGKANTFQIVQFWKKNNKLNFWSYFGQNIRSPRRCKKIISGGSEGVKGTVFGFFQHFSMCTIIIWQYLQKTGLSLGVGRSP